ncbi:hypothetical protein D9M68_328050 [compost metagenome]
MDALINWLYETVGKVLQWLLDALLWVPQKLWQMILDGFAAVIEAIPVPDFIASAGSFFGGIPASVVYFLDFFAIREGLAMMIAALLLRFILRRIPLIG